MTLNRRQHVSEQPPAREPHQAWAGPSGLRIERLAQPAGGATLAMEPAPAGEPMWLTPAHWRDLCAAAAELGPDWAELPDTDTPPPAAAPASAPAQFIRGPQ
jgi:hypothetical protein